MKTVKKVISRVIIVGIVVLAILNYIAYLGKSNYIEIDVDSPEAKATLGVVRNYEAEKLLSTGSAARERKVWTKRYHEWPEPPEEEKIYVNPGKSTSYIFPYTYKGKEYWINTSNKKDSFRYIYKKLSDNYRDVSNRDREMVVGGDKKEEVWQLLEILSAGDNIVKGVSKGKVEQHTFFGLEREPAKK